MKYTFDNTPSKKYTILLMYYNYIGTSQSTIRWYFIFNHLNPQTTQTRYTLPNFLQYPGSHTRSRQMFEIDNSKFVVCGIKTNATTFQIVYIDITSGIPANIIITDVPFWQWIDNYCCAIIDPPNATSVRLAITIITGGSTNSYFFIATVNTSDGTTTTVPTQLSQWYGWWYANISPYYIHVYDQSTIVVSGDPTNKYNVFILQGSNITNSYLNRTSSSLPWYFFMGNNGYIWSNNGYLYLIIKNVVWAPFQLYMYSLLLNKTNNDLNVVSFMLLDWTTSGIYVYSTAILSNNCLYYSSYYGTPLTN